VLAAVTPRVGAVTSIPSGIPSFINEQQVHEFLSGLFAEDLHAKTLLGAAGEWACP
jgi:hypothetical protein